MKNLMIVAVLMLQLFPYRSMQAQTLIPTDGKNNTQLLNGDWKFKYFNSLQTASDSLFFTNEFEVAQWDNIKVPGHWELQGFGTPIYGKKLKEATGLYRTTFNVPAEWKNDPVHIAFDGVLYGYTFWVNGQYAGEYAGGYNRHTFDVSAFIEAGKANVLAVKVTTRPKGWQFDTNDCWSVSGIFRDVTLFTVHATHINDLTVKTFVSSDAVKLLANVEVANLKPNKPVKNLSVTAKVVDSKGAQIANFYLTAKGNANNSGKVLFSNTVSVDNPKLWTAETPTLYTLEITLRDKKKALQHYSQKIGFRQITWDNGILRINGSPLKLKGVNHHDLSPVNGRTVTEEEMMEDLMVMKQGNINFIRAAHYPPLARFMELCDSMGFYVMDEVPYGYGMQLLGDSSYLPILKQRAKATIWRDKNHACVVIWSVGNENPVTDIGLKTGRYVKQLDDTRPYCFPQTPTVFKEMMQKPLPDSLEFLDWHYPSAGELESYAKEVNKPLLASEYAHALGLDFGSFQEIYEIMCSYPTLAGGAIWHLYDQGIVRKTSDKISKGDKTLYAWLSENEFYDTGKNQGTDGILYANRVPQVDFYQLRKVYTPVKALDKNLTYLAGKQAYTIDLINRYDIINLTEVTCKWQIYADNKIISNGTLPLNCAPHDTITIAINTQLPAKPEANSYCLKLQFEDKEHAQFYEKSYPLEITDKRAILDGIVSDFDTKPIKKGHSIVAANYQLDYNTNKGEIALKNSKGDVLIAAGPYARVGRKPSMAVDATTASRRSKTLHTLWNPFILTQPQTTVKSFNSHQLIVSNKFKPESNPEANVSGDIAYHFSDSGYINVSYKLLPKGEEEAAETGISFIIPKTYTEFRWLGDGPYESYPGKSVLSEYGIYHLNSNDLYFSGNRANVRCALFTNAQGDGFAIIADRANISVERSDDGIILSHNSHVSGRFNKYTWPNDLFEFESGKSISGSFKIIPLNNKWPETLKALFGKANTVVKPFNPFFHSYDQ